MPTGSGRGPALVLAAMVVLAAGPSVVDGQADSGALDGLLKAGGRYVEEYERTFSAVVSKERYYQRAPGNGTDTTRVIEAEVALVAVGQSDWIVFRDVFQGRWPGGSRPRGSARVAVPETVGQPGGSGETDRG